MISATRQKIYLPKAAQRECTFMSIFTLLVSMKQSLSRSQAIADAGVCLLHALRKSFFEAVTCEEENAGIEFFASQCLRVRSKFGAPSARFDRLANALAFGLVFSSRNSANLPSRVHL